MDCVKYTKRRSVESGQTTQIKIKIQKKSDPKKNQIQKKSDPKKIRSKKNQIQNAHFFFCNGRSCGQPHNT